MPDSTVTITVTNPETGAAGMTSVLAHQAAPVTTPSNPTLPLPTTAITLFDNDHWLGIHYLPNPTITVRAANAAFNQSTSTVQVQATGWQIIDASGTVVGSGTCPSTATTITVCNNGMWFGGTTAQPGHYTVCCNNGVTGYVMVCPANSNLFQPAAAGYSSQRPNGEGAYSAWISQAPDRDLYGYSARTAGGVNATNFVNNFKADPYFHGPQDPARPHVIWVAPYSASPPSNPDPTPAEWAALATALKNAGQTGVWYECPTNEPDLGGWSTSALITYWQQCQQAILAVDPTANVMGPCSAGVYAAMNIQEVAQFLAACPVAEWTDHMENSHENLANIVALRQLFAGLKAQFASSGMPNLSFRNTETGIQSAGYGVIHPRRDARQRTILRFVAEQFGWPKEHQHDFMVWDVHGAGALTYQVDNNNGGTIGNVRAGGYALHVMSEALYGTVCTPSSPPSKLDFGAAGSAADSLLAGLHYTGSTRDVVVLATNGIEQSTVTLNVAASGSVVSWDGMGVPTQLPVTNGRIVVPVDDLLTYVFLPAGTAVTVASHWFTGLSVVGTAGPGFAANVNHGTGIPGALTPQTSTPPTTLTVTTSKPAKGFALMTSGPAWQQAGSSITAMNLSANGQQIWSYTCPTAVGYNIPAPTIGNSGDLASMSTWWTSPFGWLEQLDIPAGTITLTVTACSYGGQPDLNTSTNAVGRVMATGNPYHEGHPQQLQLAAFQLLG